VANALPGAEVKNAERRVPQSMVMSVLINGALSFAFIICILFTLGDLNAALSTPTGYPIIEILFQATKSNTATTVLISCIVFSGLMALFSTLASVSRLVWAFARDNGLPFSNFFSYVSPAVIQSKYILNTLTFSNQVHPTLRIPLNALGLVTIVVMLLNLITIGNTTAFFAILSLNTLALYISYIMPMVFFTLAKLRGDSIPFGPFRLGRFGLAINIFAIAYAIFIAIFLPFPPIVPVTAANMNYGGPVMAAVILFALLDWVISGRKRWKGPTERVEMEIKDQNDTNA
jgi:choline transport protein